MSAFTAVEGNEYQDLDGMSIGPPEVCYVTSDLAHALIGHDFSELTVTAKADDVVWITVRFPAVIEDVAILRKMAEDVLEARRREAGGREAGQREMRQDDYERLIAREREIAGMGH